MNSFLQLKNTVRVFLSCLALLGMNTKGSAQFSVVAGSTNYTQNFNSLTNGAWADGATLTGWYAKTDATASITAYGANTGSTTTAGLYALGVAGTNPLSDRALGYATSNGFTGGSGSGKNYMGWRLKNNTGAALSSITVTWTGEQWRKDNTVAQTLALTYQQATTVTNLTAGTWTAAPSIFTSPINTAGAAALDGNAPANRVANISVTITVNVPAGQEIMLRWEDVNDSGNDHILAIDDVTVNAVVANFAPTATSVQTSGTTQVGQTLTGSYTYGDTEGNLEGTSTFRWLRADNNAGLNEAAIFGATANTYTLVAADANKYIRFGVTPVATTGTPSGAEAYSAYAGPVTTSTNSLSTITADPGFTPASNINYLTYIGTNVTGTSLEVAKFNLNDVAGTPDDVLSTTLTSLSFSVSGFEQFEKIALYDDTNTEIQEVASAATVNFSGLTITAASGSAKGFSVRATFKTVVTDNDQPQLIITSATADANGSFFAAANAGGASSSVANDDNKIEVTATALQFLQDATNTNTGVDMTPAVTVKAIDTNQNTDADFTGIVTITSAGTLAAPQNENAVAGLATFTAINHTVPQIGVVLTAAASGLTDATSAPFNITVQEAGVLLFEENFDYTSGQNLTSNGWSAHSGSGTSPIKVTSSGLSYTDYGSTNIGNAAIINANGEDINKSFTPIQASGTTTYAAFLISVNTATTGGDYIVHLGPGTIGSEFRGRVYTRNVSGNLRFGVSTAGTPIEYSTTNFAFNTTYLVVVKYFFNGTNMTASLFVNPSVYSEPVTATATLTTAAAAETNIGSFAIRQSSATNIATIDGIRVGTNWGTTLGNPQYMDTATINSGNYNSVSVIDGTVTANGSITVNNAISVTGGNLEIPNNTNLIQKGAVNNNSGNITVKRNASMKRLDYVYWSSPVAGQDILGFSPLTITNRFYELDEVSNAFVALSTADFVPAKGYSIRAPNTFDPNPNAAPETFNGSFNGVPNNGDITIPVTYSGATKGFNLIGNPYPSTINATAFMAANASITTLYFWAHVNQVAASGANYATFNGVGTAAATGGAIPNGTIQTGQGFLAKVTASGTVNFTNALRVNNTANQFFRAAIVEKNRFWLNLSENNAPMNQVLVGYVTDATNAFDNKFDAQLIETAGSKLYNLIGNSEYVIQGRALPFVNTDEVALGFKTETAGNFTIAMDHFDGLFAENQDIFVKDNLTGTIHNVKETPYTFASAAGTFNDRFAVVYQNTTLGIENPALNADSIVVFKQNNALNINSGAIVMQSVKVFDISGRLIYTNNNVNAAATVINLNVAQQVLIVQITSTDNKTVSKKVVY